jgi:hypothetical protein
MNILLLLTACTKETPNISGATVSKTAVTQDTSGESEETNREQTSTDEIQETTKELTNIEIKSYESDEAQAEGVDITLNGVRFPFPCTLADLGDKWSFDSGDMSRTFSGVDPFGISYSNIGNFFTVEHKLDDGRVIYSTNVDLCYESEPVGRIFFTNVIPGKDNIEDALITRLIYNYDFREKDYWKLKINGIELGSNISETKNIFAESEVEESIQDQNITYRFKKNKITAIFSSATNDIEKNYPSDISNPVTSLLVICDY